MYVEIIICKSLTSIQSVVLTHPAYGRKLRDRALHLGKKRLRLSIKCSFCKDRLVEKCLLANYFVLWRD